MTGPRRPVEPIDVLGFYVALMVAVFVGAVLAKIAELALKILD